jgi:type IV pilus assembly protein PilB
MSQPHIIASPDQLKALLSQRSRTSLRIGDLLIESGKVTKEAVQAAVAAQAAGNNARLGDVLVGMGAVARQDLDEVIERHLGTPLIDLRQYPANPGAIARLTASVASMYDCLPVDIVDNSLVVVFPEKPAPDQLAAIRFACGHAVIAFRAVNATLLKSLVARHYPNANATFVKHAQVDRGHYGKMAATVDTAPGYFRHLVAHAISNGASDIHLRPLPDGNSRVLLRVDGMFRPVVEITGKDTVTKKTVQGMVRHIEILAGIDFFSKTNSKEGRLAIDYDNRQVDLRISIIPGASGDSVVLRLLDPVRFPASLSQLALSKPQLTALGGVLMRPHGLFVCVGPTGSGKTTTLYTMLKELQSRNLHVCTVEDPVEYRLPGVNQFDSTDFAKLLPKLLRHDPDVVMVGELRDEKTVAVALNAALTGHLVLSTVHANDSAATIHRLLGMGANMQMLASSLAGVMSQRLVRLKCVSCSGMGCQECGDTGYLGRTLVAELAKPKMSMTQMAGMPSHDEVARHLEFLGGGTMDSAILALANSGRTTWEEAASVIANPRLLPADFRVALGYVDEDLDEVANLQI